MHRMSTLLQQLEQLVPLEAAATEGPWRQPFGDTTCPFYGGPGAQAIALDDDHPNSIANTAFNTAARNLLTPENLALLIAQQAAPVAGGAFGVQMLPAAEGPGATLWGEHLYVLLPDGTITQAMWCDFFINELEGEAWGCYTDVDEVNPLPVQPTHYFTPPTAPADAA